MALRVCFISTLDTNIGDDLIRRGAEKVVRAANPNDALEIDVVNKHEPLSIYVDSRALSRLASFGGRGSRFLWNLGARTLGRRARSRIFEADLVVVAGTPALWPGHHRSEWAVPVWEGALSRLSSEVPVLTLSAGSCYPWTRQPVQFDEPRDERLARLIHESSTALTVRDELAQSLFSRVGPRPVCLPDLAFLAADKSQEVSALDGQTEVLINYMPGGGHFDFGQSIDGAAWSRVMRQCIQSLSEVGTVVAIAHSDDEVAAVRSIFDGEIRLPRSPSDYFSAIAQGKIGLTNRMHAAIAMASAGVPTASVGTDTRLLMVRKLGLPTHYAGAADASSILKGLTGLLSRGDSERRRLLALKARTEREYIEVMRAVSSSNDH